MVSYRQVSMGAAAVQAVLILIVVEDGLVHLDADDVKTERTGLNPYCSGRWSRTILIFVDNLKHLVLILIVVEDGLVQ